MQVNLEFSPDINEDPYEMTRVQMISKLATLESNNFMRDTITKPIEIFNYVRHIFTNGYSGLVQMDNCELEKIHLALTGRDIKVKRVLDIEG